MRAKTNQSKIQRVGASCSHWLRRVVRCRFIVSPKEEDLEQPNDYRSRYGFVWWFWGPKVMWQPRELRLMWLCFAIFLEIGIEGYSDQ